MLNKPLEKLFNSSDVISLSLVIIILSGLDSKAILSTILGIPFFFIFIDSISIDSVSEFISTSPLNLIIISILTRPLIGVLDDLFILVV